MYTFAFELSIKSTKYCANQCVFARNKKDVACEYGDFVSMCKLNSLNNKEL